VVFSVAIEFSHGLDPLCTQFRTTEESESDMRVFLPTSRIQQRRSLR